MITVEILESLPVGTPIELMRPGWGDLHFVKGGDRLWHRAEDRLVFASADFHRNLCAIRLLPLETLAALAEEDK